MLRNLLNANQLINNFYYLPDSNNLFSMNYFYITFCLIKK